MRIYWQLLKKRLNFCLNSLSHASSFTKTIAVLTVYVVNFELNLSLTKLFPKLPLFFNFKATIESCIKHGLKKNLFKKCTTFNLLIKLSRDCEAAKHIFEICNQIEINYLSSLNPKAKINEYNLADSMVNPGQNDIYNFNK